jgi:pimeloyl-ACP methyl ester carboxylesterase
MPLAAVNGTEISYTDTGGQGPAVRDGLGGPVTFAVVAGAPHAANVTHPDEVNQAVLGFLGELAG